MAEIVLTKRKTTQVSEEDYEYLNQFRWNFNGKYSMRKDDDKTLIMHRVIMERMTGQPIPDGYEVDHINRNKLDNRRENLRFATKSQNAMNRNAYPNSTSKYKGVGWYKATGKWQAQIKINGKNTYLGYFDSEEDAARAYDAKAKEMFGEFANLNFPIR